MQRGLATQDSTADVRQKKQVIESGMEEWYEQNIRAESKNYQTAAQGAFWPNSSRPFLRKFIRQHFNGFEILIATKSICLLHFCDFVWEWTQDKIRIQKREPDTKKKFQDQS